MPEFQYDEKQTELVNMLTEGLVDYEKALKAKGLKTKWSNFLLRAVLRVACLLNFDDQKQAKTMCPWQIPRCLMWITPFKCCERNGKIHGGV